MSRRAAWQPAACRHRCTQLSAAPPRPRRFVPAVGSRCAALSGGLLADLRAHGPATRPGMLAMTRCMAACSLAGICAQGAAGQRTPLYPCAALVLGPGTAVLGSIAAGAPLPADAADVAVAALPDLLRALLATAVVRGEEPALAHELPPEQLLAFLQAALSAASRLHGQLTSRGALCVLGEAMRGCALPPRCSVAPGANKLRTGAPRGLAAALCDIVGELASGRAFPAHVVALKGCPGLCRTLVHALLLPALRTVAVAAQLPPDRRPQSFSWGRVGNAAKALYSLLPAMESLDDGTLMQLLRAAAALLQHLPSECPTDVPSSVFYCEAIGCLVHLLSLACLWLPGGDCAAWSRAAQHVVTAVRRLPALLQLHGTASLPQQNAAVMCAAWARIAKVLGRECSLEGGGAAFGLGDLPAWAAAATGMLRALPAALQLARQAADEQAAPPDEALALALLSAAREVAAACNECISAGAIAGAIAIQAGHNAAAADAAAAAAHALWSLHSTACRLAHCPDVLSQLDAAVGPPGEAASAKAISLLTLVLNAALGLGSSQDTALQQGAETRAPRPPLHGHAMSRCCWWWRGGDKDGLRHGCKLTSPPVVPRSAGSWRRWARPTARHSLHSPAARTLSARSLLLLQQQRAAWTASSSCCVPVCTQTLPRWP